MHENLENRLMRSATERIVGWMYCKWSAGEMLKAVRRRASAPFRVMDERYMWGLSMFALGNLILVLKNVLEREFCFVLMFGNELTDNTTICNCLKEIFFFTENSQTISKKRWENNSWLKQKLTLLQIPNPPLAHNTILQFRAKATSQLPTSPGRSIC